MRECSIFQAQVKSDISMCIQIIPLIQEENLLAICVISCCLISILHKMPILISDYLILPETHLCSLVPPGTHTTHLSFMRGLIQVSLITCKSSTQLLTASARLQVSSKCLPYLPVHLEIHEQITCRGILSLSTFKLTMY